MMRVHCVRESCLAGINILLMLLCLSCHDRERPAQPAEPQERADARTDEPATTPPAAVPREALPRSVVGVTLGMMRIDAEGPLGPLTCRDSKVGYQICESAKEQIEEARHIELYVYHDQVISVSYDGPAPSNAWDALNRLIDRYGRPTLSGVRERDKTGRLHEIYGWKDDQSLYSVRFVWRELESQDRQLVQTAIALWDRKGYQLWEEEMHPRSAPTPTADQPREPA